MQRSWLHRTSYSEKVTLLKKYLFLKKLFFWKSSYAEEPPASEKYMFWMLLQNIAVAVLKKYLSSRSSWSEKVFVTKT